MQFAYLDLRPNERCVLDIQEYQWLMTTPLPTFVEGERPDPDTAPHHVAYGCYLPQLHLDREAVVAAAEALRGTWCRVLREGAWDGLGIADLMVLDPVKHGTGWKVPIAALIQAPERIIHRLKERSVQAVVASRHYSNLDPLTTVLNRPGLVALLSLEQRKGPSDPADWQAGVDRARAVRTAEKIR
jgi:hypothetical protein